MKKGDKVIFKYNKGNSLKTLEGIVTEYVLIDAHLNIFNEYVVISSGNLEYIYYINGELINSMGQVLSFSPEITIINEYKLLQIICLIVIIITFVMWKIKKPNE